MICIKLAVLRGIAISFMDSLRCHSGSIAEKASSLAGYGNLGWIDYFRLRLGGIRPLDGNMMDE